MGFVDMKFSFVDKYFITVECELRLLIVVSNFNVEHKIILLKMGKITILRMK